MRSLDDLVADDWISLKRLGLSDAEIAEECEPGDRCAAKETGCALRPVYRRIDSVAGEVEGDLELLLRHLGRGRRGRAPKGRRHRVVILGFRPEPHRPRHRVRLLLRARGVQALRELGYKTVMVNCNPETVSTDYDTSTACTSSRSRRRGARRSATRDKPDGVIDPVRRPDAAQARRAIEDAGVAILGTAFDAIDLAEDRERFGSADRRARHPLPAAGASRATARRGAPNRRREIGYPVLVRPSYVLGGRAMQRRATTRGPRTTSSAYHGRARARAVARTSQRRSGSRCRPSTVPRRRGRARRRSRRRQDGAVTSGPSWSTSRKRASTRATRRASCLRYSLDAADIARDQRQVAPGSRPSSGSSASSTSQLAISAATCSCSRQPARVAHDRREQGDRHPSRRRPPVDS